MIFYKNVVGIALLIIEWSFFVFFSYGKLFILSFYNVMFD